MATKTKVVNRLPDLEVPNGKTKEKKPTKLVIPELRIQGLEIEIRGIAPLCIRAWDEKTANQLAQKAMGEKAPKERENVDPEATFNAARYISTEGWDGVPASAFKAALVRAVSCLDIPVRDFSMTAAKMCFFIEAQGVDKVSGRDLIKILGPKPKMFKLMQPTAAGTPYMSYRPLYRNWGARLRISFNGAKIDAQGVLNLLAVAGHFVGVGEHRPASRESFTGTMGRWEVVPGKS